MFKKKSPANLMTEMSDADLIEEAGQALYRIPVFLSRPTPFNAEQAAFLARVIAEIRAALLFPRTLPTSDQYTETPLTSIRRMMMSSYGCLAIAFRRILVPRAVANPGAVPPFPREIVFNEPFWLTSPYSQIEPSMAYQRGLPLMLLLEDGVNQTSTFGGVWEQGATPLTIIRFNLETQTLDQFFSSSFWRETFADWVGQVRSGYTIQTEPEFRFRCASSVLSEKQSATVKKLFKHKAGDGNA
jgi:hypothetical protein